jgi:Zn-dependent protease
MTDLSLFLQQKLLTIPPLLFALTVHECAHSVIADRLGDPTGRMLGRSTLNPLPHLDPIGTFMLFFVGFGWGRPVPVDPRNFRRPRKDMAIVAFAGPFSNILTAALFAVLFRLIAVWSFELPEAAYRMILYGVQISLVLVFFNLFPFPPLDGSRILVGLLSQKRAIQFQGIERTLMMILPIMIITEVIFNIPIFWRFLGPVVRICYRLLIGV